MFICSAVCPNFPANVMIAPSVGSPAILYVPDELSSLASLASEPMETRSLKSGREPMLILLPSSFTLPTGSYPIPSTSSILSSTNAFTTVISFCVRVPVLSEHITDVAPSVSTAKSFFTMAFFPAILFIPIDKTIVTIAGRPSGIAATARLMDVKSISSTCLP